MGSQRVKWSVCRLSGVGARAPISRQFTEGGVPIEARLPMGRAQLLAGEPCLDPDMLPMTLRASAPGLGSLYPPKGRAGHMARILANLSGEQSKNQ